MARRTGPATGTAMRRRSSTIEHAEAQNAVYAAPWLLLLLAAAAGQILHFLYASDPSFSSLVVAGVVVGTLALLGAGYVSTHERSWIAIGHTLVTIVVSGAWMVLCAVTGIVDLETVDGVPFSVPLPQRPTVDLWIIVGAVLCLVWNLRQGVRVNEARAAESEGEKIDDWAEAGFPGVRGRLKRVNEYRSEGTLTIPKGMYLEQLQKGARAIESAFDYPPKSLTLLPVKDRSRKVMASVLHKNPLETKVVWPGVDV